MPRHKPSASSPAQLRRTIASAAARLMAEGGISDYGSAKRKAARQLGSTEGDALPSNSEVETELRAYQAIFQDDEQHGRIRELRETALEVMALLVDFRPCLTGAVLDGTASRYAPIQIDLFADSSKDVEIFLLSQGVSYSSDEIRRQTPLSAETRLHLDWDADSVELMIYPPAAERVLPRDSRARMPAVQVLLTQTTDAVPE
ncbi:MAG: hypothetical protein KBA96_04360 [Rhodocyclaceae bacterium]|nr:hypothetical protein [Rhodocyclaceae bacterium]MBP7080321.1 hypothetical protein [Rhodocyclaceae bacterium]